MEGDGSGNCLGEDEERGSEGLSAIGGPCSWVEKLAESNQLARFGGGVD